MLYLAKISGKRLQDHWSSGSETIAASELKAGRCRQLIEFMKIIVRLSLLRKTLLNPEYKAFMCVSVCVFVDGSISQF